MNEQDWLADRFETHRPHLRSVAYRMLGSLSEAEDAVQESWLRLSRSDTSGVENLAGWLTTVVGRVCLDMLRSRTSRREDPVGAHMPDPIFGEVDADGPEQQVMLANSVGLAMLVVLDTLEPAERLAFVLHDMFAMPFADIGAAIGRSPEAARQLASRARRRVQGVPAAPDADLPRQREVVDAFFAAAHRGDFEALVAVLAPDVELRTDARAMPAGTARHVVGAAAVAGQALTFSRFGMNLGEVRQIVVNGGPAMVAVQNGRPQIVMAFTVAEGRISAIAIYADAARLATLDLGLDR
ncbi:sigma-70 family RNA polymerase sigma factor [Pseudonocardia sp. TRM90224]|uniref:sigma-70 family RNA polymerase sigma factor n=1 Tax=Pseudonocardia sp. TRM90224 TaxID=2812678 RepID=UPI001E580560|nr:sigma-70 family RNA polymerase sigma factor [Pseudonocardia sp. TRM90224]